MKNGIELVKDYVMILPDEVEYKNKSGLILFKPDTPEWYGTLIDKNNIKGVRNGDRILYSKANCEGLVLNDIFYHIINIDDAICVIQ